MCRMFIDLTVRKPLHYKIWDKILANFYLYPSAINFFTEVIVDSSDSPSIIRPPRPQI